MFADMPVRVTCGLCGHSQQLHAFRLIRMIGKRADAAKLPLWQPIDNLLTCRTCRKRVPAKISAPMQWA